MNTPLSSNIIHNIKNKMIYLGLVLGLSCASAELPAPLKIEDKTVSSEAKEWVTQNIGIIMKSQEEALGINHFGTPSLEFKGCGRGGDRGEYDPDNDILILYIPRFDVHFSPSTTGEILRHELGHFYADKLSECLGYGSWPPEDDDLGYVRYGLLAEGIAESFNNIPIRNGSTFQDSQWPDSLEGFIQPNQFLLYSGGQSLVEPVIKSFGESGIRYLIRNPPNTEDLTSLPNYQKEALGNLANNNL